MFFVGAKDVLIKFRPSYPKDLELGIKDFKLVKSADGNFLLRNIVKTKKGEEMLSQSVFKYGDKYVSVASSGDELVYSEDPYYWNMVMLDNNVFYVEVDNGHCWYSDGKSVVVGVCNSPGAGMEGKYLFSAEFRPTGDSLCKCKVVVDEYEDAMNVLRKRKGKPKKDEEENVGEEELDESKKEEKNKKESDKKSDGENELDKDTPLPPIESALPVQPIRQQPIIAAPVIQPVYQQPVNQQYRPPANNYPPAYPLQQPQPHYPQPINTTPSEGYGFNLSDTIPSYNSKSDENNDNNQYKKDTDQRGKDDDDKHKEELYKPSRPSNSRPPLSKTLPAEEKERINKDATIKSSVNVRPLGSGDKSSKINKDNEPNPKVSNLNEGISNEEIYKELSQVLEEIKSRRK
ncbi:hypothetical protein SLOPH_473 [Spraguea lophii 42_110]|uniref:Uncharacterized protein n=1 Tax=Spraguea lophii (strain 42_110) TaxID=1358809 RepID=S7XVJ7_SPRLO|nr:hypothetical protein SLOPH_473 [Spraguea lophii 42_110]